MTSVWRNHRKYDFLLNHVCSESATVRLLSRSILLLPAKHRQRQSIWLLVTDWLWHSPSSCWRLSLRPYKAVNMVKQLREKHAASRVYLKEASNALIAKLVGYFILIDWLNRSSCLSNCCAYWFLIVLLTSYDRKPYPCLKYMIDKSQEKSFKCSFFFV
jgi:hypothetical protein